ncbi:MULTISPECIES: phosphate-starvation-inducible PsiE family protein [unclassified Synechococcus]|uniref:phosphate-starvation-inducible PsiE family protein n=1 Tax=unclassified Synechococcus TaxID=2626047 RepID=UPI0020CC62CE|nr:MULTISPECIES: phosphate-starvation-inducible PsiE family protein [unclassified Synechococcus]
MEKGFLRVVYGFERQLAKLLASILAAVIVVATLQLVLFLGTDLLDLRVDWTGEGLIGLLDQILVILIALEVLQNLTAYLREHVVQIELVLITALTALSRKLIVMPPGSQKDGSLLIGLSAGVLSLAVAYWLVRQSHLMRMPSRREPAKGFLEQDP